MIDIQAPARRARDSGVIRFAGDPGDRMQPTGDRFTDLDGGVALEP